MPTFIHSKLSKFFLETVSGGGSAGSPDLTDISSYCDEVTFPEELELVETTTFGSTSKTYLVGYADASISIAGNWDRTFDGYMSALKTAFRDGTVLSVTFQYGPEGSDAGDTQYTGECVLINYEKNSAVKDQVKFSAEFQVTGQVNSATF